MVTTDISERFRRLDVLLRNASECVVTAAADTKVAIARSNGQLYKAIVGLQKPKKENLQKKQLAMRWWV